MNVCKAMVIRVAETIMENIHDMGAEEFAKNYAKVYMPGREREPQMEEAWEEAQQLLEEAIEALNEDQYVTAKVVLGYKWLSRHFSQNMWDEIMLIVLEDTYKLQDEVLAAAK